MRTGAVTVGAVVIGITILTGCTEGNDPPSPAIPARCGLLTPNPAPETDAIPREFLLEGVEVAKVESTKKRVSAALNNPRSVAESFDLFLKAAERAGFEIVGRDNEGFEAEIYLRRGSDLGAVQIRSSRCDEATVVFLNIVRT